MPGIALTDHGAMFGIKEFFDYVNKKNGPLLRERKDLKKQIKALRSRRSVVQRDEAKLSELREQLSGGRSQASLQAHPRLRSLLRPSLALQEGR